MDDIVTRLRRWTHAVDAAPASDLMDEAADEIERLRRKISGGSAVRCIGWFDGESYENNDAKRRIANMSGEWIPVGERLPKGGEPIVLGFGGGYALPSMAEWKNGGLVWCHRPNIVGSSGGPNTPTHWMPLPAPPTDGK